jgi:hypothetical protein
MDETRSELEGPMGADQLDALLHALCDGVLDGAGYARLNELLNESDAACQRYIEFMDLQVSLVHCCVGLDRGTDRKSPRPSRAGLLGAASSQGDLPADDPAADGTPISFPRLGANDPLNAGPSATGSTALASTGKSLWRALLGSPWGLSGLAAAALVFVSFGLWYGRPYLEGRRLDESIAQHGMRKSSAADTGLGPNSTIYVARVVRATPNVEWGDSNSALDFLLRIRPGERVDVAKGLVQLEFFSGAKIILHGPAVFVPTGARAGRLESGRLTGDVAGGNFSLTTPAAEVIDLGTEFGVSVDAATGTDVFVFNGEVKVVSRPNTDISPEVLNMTEGMAARIRCDGTADYELHAQPGEFARSFPKSSPPSDDGELSLVDILSGGNGLGTRLAGAVDPVTGQLDRGDWRANIGAGRRFGDGKYHTADWHPLIDGLFVPSHLGKRVQIDSLGATVDLPPMEGFRLNAEEKIVKLPPEGGGTWGPLWARRCNNDMRTTEEAKDFWGTNTLGGILARLKDARLGVVGIHPNVGVTFDLRAVRFEQRRCVGQFRATLANLDFSRWTEPERAKTYHSVADFRVFVDGELRFSRLRFGRDDGESEVVVDLTAKDRFLTLVSTDADGLISFDHIVLIDPILLLKKP